MSGLTRGRIAAAVALVVATAACGQSDSEGVDASAQPADDPDAAIRPERPDSGCPVVAGSQTFDFTGAIATFTVPDCVESIAIEARGAQGGNGIAGPAVGGLGARASGTFTVQPGDVLEILVGGQGADAVSSPQGQGGGCGAGGSFVATMTGAPLVVAGGGGGATSNPDPNLGIQFPGGHAVITEDGQAGSGDTAGAGGTAGGGGTTGSNPGGFHSGTGGGGFFGNGIGLSDGNQGDFGTPNSPGLSFVSGGAGGIGGSQGRGGGFGGGGAAGFTGGGGGGYSGGGGGAISNLSYGAGGGGSFCAGADPVLEAGAQTGDGQVVISW